MIIISIKCFMQKKSSSANIAKGERNGKGKTKFFTFHCRAARAVERWRLRCRLSTVLRSFAPFCPIGNVCFSCRNRVSDAWTDVACAVKCGILSGETWPVGPRNMAFCILKGRLRGMRRPSMRGLMAVFTPHWGGFCVSKRPLSLHIQTLFQVKTLVLWRLCLHTENGRIHARRILFSERCRCGTST